MQAQQKGNGDPGSDGCCPYSGLPIVRRPEWTDVQISSVLVSSVFLLGEQVMVTRPHGYATSAEVHQLLVWMQGIMTKAFPDRRPFLWIADYSQLSGFSRTARRIYLETVREWDQLHALILCGLSPALTLSARLAARMVTVGFDVHTVDSYGEGARLAASVLAKQPLPKVVRPSTVRSLADGDRITSDRWQLQSERFSIRYEVIDGTVLHSQAIGILEARHVEAVLAVQERVFASAGLQPGHYSILGGLEGLGRVSVRARGAYLRAMVDWHQRYPFRCIVFYGANRFLRAAIHVTRPFAPFPVRLAADQESGRALLGGLSAEPETVVAAAAPDASRSEALARYEEELLRALGSISWQLDEQTGVTEVDPSHPLSNVFEAINLVKAEVEELLRERAQVEEERTRLQQSLARSRRMEALGLLAGGVAHDLNNILSGVVTFPDLLLLDESLAPRHRVAIESIRQSGRRAAAVVDELVTIARGGSGKRGALDLNAVVSEYLQSPEAASVQRSHPTVTITHDLAPYPLPVNGSALHLQKAVMNLVTNAIEAAAGGGGSSVTVSTARRFVDRPLRGYDDVLEGEYAQLSVRDDGPGIPADEVERVFEPFYSKKVLGRSGTGLGLTVVWNTAQDHNGYVDLDSGDGGTCFDLYLPITKEQIMEVTPQSMPLQDYRGQGERILVVDDVESQRQIACEMLQALGYRAEAVASGEAAIERLRQQPFDLLLLDMIMEPGINGRQTFEAAIQVRPQQRAIIVSGYSETEEVRRALALGAGQFVRKPYSLERIAVAVHQAVSRGAVRPA